MIYALPTPGHVPGSNAWRRVITVAVVATVISGVAAWSPLSKQIAIFAFQATAVDTNPVLTIAPDTTANYSIRFRNDGPATWKLGDPQAQVNLGVKADSMEFATAGIAVGWLSPTRVATTTESVVAPGGIGTFAFTVRAPTVLGVYRIPLRLVVDGVTWLEDENLALVLGSDFGFHSEFIGQSRHPTLRPSELSGPITMTFRNRGIRTWVRGKTEQQVNLGVEGDDRSPTALAAGWPSADRVAIQSESSVPPGGTATFAFRVRAPPTPGTYVLRLRPVVDGVTWLDDSVVSVITVAGSGQAHTSTPSGSAGFTSNASVTPSRVSAGGSVNISLSFTSASAVKAIVGFEIYASGGTSLAFQRWFDPESFVVGQPLSYPVSWQVPVTAAIGEYKLNLRVLASDWKTLLSSHEGAATFAIEAPVDFAQPTARPTSVPSARTPGPATQGTATPSTAPTAKADPTAAIGTSLPQATSIPATAALARDVLVFDSDRTGNFEIFSIRSDGSAVRQLTSDQRYDSFWAKVSPDRTRILFYRTPKGVHDHDYMQASLWVMSANGSMQRELRPRGADGWILQGHAEWSPDGTNLVMSGGTSETGLEIFLTDIEGRTTRRVTDRGGVNIDPSWSPDGRMIVFIGCPVATACTENQYEVFAVPVAGGAPIRLTDNVIPDFDPYYAPDGRQIAWLARTDPSGVMGAWNIMSMSSDGSEQRNVTNDGQINSKPAWSTDGQLIYFHRFDSTRANRWQIFSVRPDGTALREIAPGAPGNNEYPSN